MNFNTILYVICFFIFLFLKPQASSSNDLNALLLAQSQNNPGSGRSFEEEQQLGSYAVGSSLRSSPRRFGLRFFGAFNFASNIKSHVASNSLYGGFRNRFANSSMEYIFPHKEVLGSFSFGGSVFMFLTNQIGAIATLSFELQSKVEQYKYKQYDNNYGGSQPIQRGHGCGQSSRDRDYLLCPLSDQFWYSILSAEVSAQYQVMPMVYIFAGPNFFIPIGFRTQPSGIGGFVGRNPLPPKITGGIGGQAGIGGNFRSFFMEVLFKTQNMTLEGITISHNQAERLETGRLWGLMIRGGIQI